jgi:WD40 repeat protein
MHRFYQRVVLFLGSLAPFAFCLAAAGHADAKSVIHPPAKPLWTIKGAATELAFSRDGKLLAGIHDRSKVTVWNRLTGKEVAKLQGGHMVGSIAFSPDGKYLAMGTGYFPPPQPEGEIYLFEIATAKKVATLTGHREIVDAVAFSPDGKLLASACRWHDIKLWDMASRKEVASLPHYRALSHRLAFSADGKTLFFHGSGNDKNPDAGVWSFSIDTRKETNYLKLPADAQACLSPDGKTVAAARLGVVELFDLASGKSVATFKHKQPLGTMSFSPDGRFLALASDGEFVHLWNVAERREMKPLPTHLRTIVSLAWTPDGTCLAISGAQVSLWNVTNFVNTK